MYKLKVIGEKIMFNHTIEITADNQPTILERLLQVTRYRGFVVTGFTVFANTDNKQLDIKLTVQDPKEQSASMGAGVSRLQHQLNKLFDIKRVDFVQSTPLQCQA